MRHFLANALLLIGCGMTAFAAGCRERSLPSSYVRLSGSAPVLADVPATRATLVVFWAVWCEPCRTETPSLRALAADPPEGLSVVVVGHDPDLAVVEQFLGAPPDPAWHFRLDPDRAVADAFGVPALPATYLVVDGRLVARFVGPRDWESGPVRDLLQKLMNESPR